jgi:hypothetical protein
MPRRTTTPTWFLERWRRVSAEMAGCVGGVCYRPGSVESMLARLEVAARGDATWAEMRRAMRVTLLVLLDELEG